jgi:hypothetical protein
VVKNDSNVYILGAGFSRDAGIPLVSDFLDRMRDCLDLIDPEEDPLELESVNRILDFMQRATSASYRVRIDIENVEELFSLAAAKDADNLRYHMIEAISTTIRHCSRFPNPLSKISIHTPHRELTPKSWIMRGGIVQKPPDPREWFAFDANIYDYMAGIISGQYTRQLPIAQNSVITFNYDIELEKALDRIGATFGYGLDNDESVLRPSLSESLPLPIYKVHGSVNWWEQDGNPDALTVTNGHDPTTENRRRVLVPPTWQKSFGGPLREVWQGALEAIENATRIVVVGFSMPPTDLHFRYLLAAGLQHNVSLRDILFVNPDPDFGVRLENLFTNQLLSMARFDSANSQYVKRVRHLHQTAGSFFLNPSLLAQIGRARNEEFGP